ncbi:MAG: hypothetical protein A4E52_00375 [Pelotomaculum sp. PtaB.Bin013]|uniref:Stalk domain-containing protein n=1 Tax=Pelotomaculum isophthalicicum JI TaxID=947010 RepID=A0A9X4H6X9_9FIRM|nr:stalk domain-containing protein [Pelotomaculum isophthalicicum]MDF9409398.1 stalk domain-containing protein [Pelotomaculum isophthalicicum JI]OPX91760.1 MAG: hypothetical protein A4E52_00375 [Pelotomaculum sp. PtaB.Bin013]
MRTWLTTVLILSLAVFCITLAGGAQPAPAAVSPLSIELGEAQEYGLQLNNFWDLQRNTSVDHNVDELFRFYGYNYPSLTYREGDDGGFGFMDVGALDKPAGREVLQITPLLLAYNGKQEIEAGHFYILKTLTLGYFALYIDDIPLVNDDRYVNFTLYRLKGAPAKVASAPPVITAPSAPVTPSVPATPSTPVQTPAVTSPPAAPRQWPGGNTEPAAQLTEITFNQKPMVVNDRTFVPLRDLFEALGAEVQWDGATQTILASKGQNKVILQIDNKVAFFNGQPRQLEAAPFINGDKTFVPLRFASEALGEKVSYDSATGKVVFGKHYFFLDKGNSSSPTAQPDSTAGQETVKETSGPDSDDMTLKDVDRYWNERMRYDMLQKSLFGR